MKLLDKFVFASFLIHTFLIVFIFVGIPVMAVAGFDIFSKITENSGYNLYNLSLSLLSPFPFFHWIYCIWFLFKYDRYSASIFPLFLFGGIYAPIYYFRVKIMKRPLRNKIND